MLILQLAIEIVGTGIGVLFGFILYDIYKSSAYDEEE